MRAEAQDAKRGPWSSATVSSIAGFLFSVSLSLIIGVGLIFQFQPLVSLERAGSDFGMKVHSALRLSGAKADARGYVFIDVDSEACRSLSPAGYDCAAERLISAEVVARFVEMVKRGGARVAVIDSAIDPSSQAEVGQAPDAAVATRGANEIGYVTILDARPSDSGAGVVVPRGALLDPSGAHFRAPSLTYTELSEDRGLVRGVPYLVQVNEGGRASWRPSVALLSAGLLEGGDAAQKVRCLAFGQDRNCLAPDGVLTLGPNSLSLQEMKKARAARVFFSLPSMVGHSPDREAYLRLTYLDLYQRYRMADLLERDEFRSLLEGKLVVLGTSARSGQDWHATPTGPMPGAEILINAVQSLRAHRLPPIGNPTLAQRVDRESKALASKAIGALIAALLLLPIWAAASSLLTRSRKGRALERSAAFLGAVVVVVLGVGATFILELGPLLGGLVASTNLGAYSDLFIPVVAVGVQLFADIISRLSRWLEIIAATLLRSTLELLSFKGGR